MPRFTNSNFHSFPNAPQPFHPSRGIHHPAFTIEPWMTRVLKIAGWYNLVAGLAMMVLYHEGFKLLGVPKPEMNLPIQLVGLFVALFGVGYLRVARDPLENRQILLLGFLSKLLGPVLAIGYIVNGQLPMTMLPVLIVADVIYLAPFWMIYRHTGRLHHESSSFEAFRLAEHRQRSEDEDGAAEPPIRRAA